jgi:hypothetical protein
MYGRMGVFLLWQKFQVIYVFVLQIVPCFLTRGFANLRWPIEFWFALPQAKGYKLLKPIKVCVHTWCLASNVESHNNTKANHLGHKPTNIMKILC